jgi:hypothetical protein
MGWKCGVTAWSVNGGEGETGYTAQRHHGVNSFPANGFPQDPMLQL